MKLISQFTKIVPIILAMFVLQACSDDDDSVRIDDDQTIVEIAQDTDDLSILVSALAAADGDLVSVLNGDGPFTVFAPTNEAFVRFLSDNGFSDLDEVPTDVLSQVLLNHVVSGDVSSSDLTTLGSGYSTTNASGSGGNNLSLYFNTSTGVVLNGISNVTNADIEASNGVIHIVDEVIALPTIADFALANADLSNLVAAILLADTDESDPDYLGILSSPGTYTVFAPTNDAFVDLLDELDPSGETALGDLDPALVGAVLNYHVVAGANVTSSDLVSGTVNTIGGPIELDATNLTLTDENERISNIIPTLVDIQATNGVVHAIDAVILPPQE